MRRTTTILLVGALLAALALGALAPTAGAQQGTDVQTTTPDADATNATEVRAQYMAQWMETRMGPEGVEAFEEETGTSIEAVSEAMAEYMGPWAGDWNAPDESERYGPDTYGPNNYGPGGYGPGSYGPGMPCHGGYGPGMGGYGPGTGGSGSGMGW